MNHIPIVDLKVNYKALKVELDPVIKRVIEETCFINGEDNKLFDEEFALYCGTKYSIGVGSGSVALDFAVEALGIKSGDEVICPTHTFTATAEAIVHQGAIPVFVDVDEDTHNIDPKLIEGKITHRTKAIIPVHMYGNPVDMDPLIKIAKKYKLKIIEDCAQAHGALYHGKKVGTLGDVACFSFFPAKNLGCFGDGGSIVTNNKKIAQKIQLLKDHGRFNKYNHQEIGYGGRLDNFQAAILRVKLKHLDSWNKKRRKIAEIYNDKLKNKYIIPKIPQGCTSVYYVYTLRSKKRDQIIAKLKENGISVGIYYPVPLHLQKAYQYLNYKKGDFPITEKICREIFSIPMFPELNEIQINKIIKCLQEEL